MTRRYKKIICLLLCLAFVTSLVGEFNINSYAITDSQQEYIETIGAAASEDMIYSGVLASLTVSQAIMEAGWGTSTMARLAKNLFGIKANASWTGMVYDSQAGVVHSSYSAYVAANTSSYVASNTQRIWRAYSTWYESLADHSLLLTSASRYDDIPYEYDYVAAAWNIIEDGYASDMEYTKKIINCIEVYNLSRFDIIEYPADQIVIVTKTRKYLPVNEVWQLPVTVIQPFGGEDTLTYTSSDPTVAEIDETGLITAVTDGECLITVTSSTGWHACCYIATYDPETVYAEYICSGDIPMYAEASDSSEVYGTLPSRHCVIGIGEKIQDENGVSWRKVRAKVLTGTEVLVKTGYVHASDITYSVNINYVNLTDAVSLTLDSTEISLPQYTSFTLNASVFNEAGATPSATTVRWISDNPEVATVTAGKVKGVGEGECTVYAVSTDGVYASCKVTVTPGVYIPVEGLELDKTEITLTEKDTYTLTAYVTPDDATEPEVEWTSSNELIATVVRGKITAVEAGECVITATVGEISASCKVTVEKWVYTGIKYDGVVLGNKVNLRQGPATSYASLGRVNDGDTLVLYGTASNNWYNVLVTSGSCEGLEGYIYADYVQVCNEQVETLVFNTEDTVLIVGDTLNLSWTVDPSESTVSFESSDATVAAVSEKGVVAAVSEGTAQITAKAGKLTATITVTVSESGFTGTKYIARITTNGGTLNMREGPGTDYNVVGKLAYNAEVIVYGDAQDGWYAVYGKTISGTDASGFVSAEWVTVLGKYANSLSLNENSAVITEGGTYTLLWQTDPSDVTVTFTSEDTGVATVDADGVITAIGAGSTKITVYAGGKTAVFTVTVLADPAKDEQNKLIPKEGISVSDGYVLGVREFITAEELTAMFENDAEYIVITLSSLKYAGTGTKVELKDEDGNITDTATVIVLGDCDGNGYVTTADYLITRRIVLGTYNYTDVQYEAARTAGMPAVTATDFLMIRRHVLGIYDIYTQESLTE